MNDPTKSYEFTVEFTGTAIVHLIAEDDEEAAELANAASPDDPSISSFDIDEKSIEVTSIDLKNVEVW